MDDRDSADGIGTRDMGCEIATATGRQGAAWLEREEREREEWIDPLLTALALKPGKVEVDIGAGIDWSSRCTAAAVSSSSTKGRERTPGPDRPWPAGARTTKTCRQTYAAETTNRVVACAKNLRRRTARALA